MQTKNSRHCSLNEDPKDRVQCDTCHGYEREEAAEKAKVYAKKNFPISMETDPLETIADICRSLTYGEMMELEELMNKFAQGHLQFKEGDMAKTIHLWSQDYGMDNNNAISSGNNIANTNYRFDGLGQSDEPKD